MDADTATKLAAGGAGLFGLVLGLLNWRVSRRLSVHKLTETELEVLRAGLEGGEPDPAYRIFLQNLHKEKLAGLAFGCPVPLRELGRLMAYHEQGFATTEQIRLAWPHRNPPEGALSFALGRADKLQLWLARIYLVLCWVAGGLLTILALWPPWKLASLVTAGTAACFLGFGFLDVRVHRGLFVANVLGRCERRENLVSMVR